MPAHGILCMVGVGVETATETWRRKQLTARNVHHAHGETKESTAETTGEEAKEVEATAPTTIHEAEEDVVANVARLTAQ